MELKTQIIITKTVNVKILAVDVGVRYWEDGEVNGVGDQEGNLIPCRDGDRWKPLINIDTGQITNWETGLSADVHYKVCDDGEYHLLDEDGKVVKTSKKIYVPKCLNTDDGDADYIVFEIDRDGFIQDWDADFDDFDGEDE